MAEVRLNVRDRHSVIHGDVHGSIADAVIAALSAEPETITELEAALERFIKPKGDVKPLGLFREGLNQEPCAAGIIIVDMAARIVAGNSSYSPPLAQGQIQYHTGSKLSDVWLPYRLPDDWLFLDSITEYEARHQARLAEHANDPLDARAVLYGPPMIGFLVNECLAARKASSEDPIAEIHASWLMTPRTDLRGQTPREVIMEKRDFIGFDLQFREFQWSVLGEGPPPLPRDSFAYRFAGFGTHEWVIYYDLLRHLLNSCWEQTQGEEPIDVAAENARLEAAKRAWLEEPCDDLGHRIPSAIIESERRRIPMTLTARQMIIDEDCDVCRMIGDESAAFGPGFWHLDGSHMDDGFEFSHFLTRADYEEEERQRREFDEEFNRKWAAGELD